MLSHTPTTGPLALTSLRSNGFGRRGEEQQESSVADGRGGHHEEKRQDHSDDPEDPEKPTSREKTSPVGNPQAPVGQDPAGGFKIDSSDADQLAAGVLNQSVVDSTDQLIAGVGGGSGLDAEAMQHSQRERDPVHRRCGLPIGDNHVPRCDCL